MGPSRCDQGMGLHIYHATLMDLILGPLLAIASAGRCGR